MLEYLKRSRRLPVAPHVRRQPRQRLSAISWPVRSNSTTASRPPKASSTRRSPGEPRDRKIYIAWDEWNVWYRARGNTQRGRRILEERYNLEDALVVATFLNSFVNHAHIVKIANMAQLVNVIAPIFTNDKGMFLQTIYYPLAAVRQQHARARRSRLFVDSPKYKSTRFGRRALPGCLRRWDNGDGCDQRREPPSRSGDRSRDRN